VKHFDRREPSCLAAVWERPVVLIHIVTQLCKFFLSIDWFW